MKKEINSAKNLADAIVEGVQEKKGMDIVILDLSKLENTICQYYVICQGESTTQVDAIGNSIDEYVKEAIGEQPNHKEGFQNAQWIILDYFDVIAHVFHKDERPFYNLEGLWADAKRIDIPNLF